MVDGRDTPDVTQRSIDAALLAVLGVLGVHQVAYLLAGASSNAASVTHGHLQYMWILGSVAALIGVGSQVVKSVQRRGHELSHGALARWIGVGYTAMESAERVVDGLDPLALLAEPVFWIGLALTPLVAFFLAKASRTFVALVCHALKRRPTSFASNASTAQTRDDSSPGDNVRLAWAITRRGPPSVLVASFFN